MCWAIGGFCLSGTDHQKFPTWVVYTKNHDATNIPADRDRWGEPERVNPSLRLHRYSLVSSSVASLVSIACMLTIITWQ